LIVVDHSDTITGPEGALAARSSIRFYLNDELVVLDGPAPHRTVLDWLRLERQLRGTKEGCAEGDCGACTVLVGRLRTDGQLAYEAINACIRFLVTLDGCHLVTVENLARDGMLNPVQRAMVECHGSQCGFCTPGMVMSLYGDWLDNPRPTRNQVEHTIQGNLCRCTGYETIVRAAQAASDYGDPFADRLNTGRAEMAERLKALREPGRVDVESGAFRAILPTGSDELAEVLLEEPGATIVAGATDVALWTNKLLRQPSPMVFLTHVDDLDFVRVEDEALILGARTAFNTAREAIATHFPPLRELWDRIGGQQVRNAGTIGGNIANGSPIGDTPPPLIALGAHLTLRRGQSVRTLLLEDFFIDYGRQDLQPGEFIQSVTIPLPHADDLFAAYKVSKRWEEDITSVLGAFRLRLEAGRVSEIVIAYGGMAATPKRARHVEAALLGQPWTRATVEAAMSAYADDFTPLSDWRASAGYRLLVARNLLLRFWSETEGGAITRVRELADG
jgi:xanthine dehydrogenase small subunit